VAADADLLDSTSSMLEAAELTPVVCSSLPEAEGLVEEKAALPNVLLVDLDAPGLGAADAKRLLAGRHALAAVPVVLLVHGDAASLALSIGEAAVLPKPFTLEQMLHVLERCRKRNR
jgi:DNA-binding NtrC family response regulator